MAAAPITQFLDQQHQGVLTPAAKQLNEDDLVALAWHKDTPRTSALTVTDINSIVSAFADQRKPGGQLVGIACCTCTPACCCTAAAVPHPFKH